MSSKLHEQVDEFMEAFGQYRSPIGPTANLPTKTLRLRARLIIEEAFEFLEAIAHIDCVGFGVMKRDALALIDTSEFDVDLPEVVDALADLDYVVEGTRIAFGVDGGLIADEVHRANMTKVGGPIVNGKQLKPKGWQPPDIEGCLRKQGWKR